MLQMSDKKRVRISGAAGGRAAKDMASSGKDANERPGRQSMDEAWTGRATG
jgi:hypothetical protein